ncbi:MAG: LytTR family DNA-binding domain-containing protein [Bacteroidetes bacterium]|nr:LytTR family DNA-binding domain-containing protein [Bacteroidota bacterium]
MIKAIIVEDEVLAREKLRFFLEDFPNISVVDECGDAVSALEAIKKHKPDLIFLDIQLPGISGMELIRSITKNSPGVIFTTAFDNYAIEAFDFRTLGYLLKPFDRQRFRTTMLKALEKLGGTPSSPSPAGKIPVKKEGDKGKFILLDTNEINNIQSNGNTILIHTDTSLFTMQSTLDSMEKLLGDKQFMRVHRTAIVNREKIVEIENLSNNEYQLKLKNGKKIWTGRKYAAAIQTLLKI